MSITFACERCGKAHKVDERFGGRRAACKGCGVINRIPEVSNVSAGEAAAATVAGEVLPPIPAARPMTPVRALPVDGCPSCGSALPGGSYFCTDCGFNLKTGQKVVVAIPVGEADGGEA